MCVRCAGAESGVGTGWALLILLLLILLSLRASPALAAEPKFPPLTGRVVDEAGVLNASTQSELTEMLAQHERATGEQVVVVTLASLQGYSIEDFGYQLGRNWGIGQKDKNTGALLIVAPNEHKVRIEVGYGLEGKLTDAISRAIIERDILPAFRRGDFNAGVAAGAASILAVLGGEGGAGTASGIQPSADQSANFGNPMLWLAILFFVLEGAIFLSLFLKGPHYHPGRKGYVFDRPGRSALRFLAGAYSAGGYSGGGFSAGGSSGGGFSGGGGSFGGGGASGSW